MTIPQNPVDPMTALPKPVPVHAADIAVRNTPSAYPEPFASRMAGREKQALGGHFGLRNFGVNRTTLHPGAQSALRHAHSRQDEFVYVLAGEPTLVTDAGAVQLRPGQCVGFAAGTGDAHHLINHTATDAVYLEIGDRSADDAIQYPDDDLAAVLQPDGRWGFRHKDGRPY